MTRYAYAPNRRIGVNCLQALLDEGWPPSAILLPNPARAQFSDEILALVAHLDLPVFQGREIRTEAAQDALRALELDLLLSIHFPEILPQTLLDIPRLGALNLHPAFLPYNRGWHTPSWALWEQTPYGATLHWMDDGIDTGDLVAQRRVEPTPDDTANSLYQKVLAAEEALFVDTIPTLRSGGIPRVPQTGPSTAHKRRELKRLQPLDLDATVRTGDLLRRLRALTTNRVDEAATFSVDGRTYAVQVRLQELEPSGD